MSSVIGRIPKRAGYVLAVLMLTNLVVAVPAAHAEDEAVRSLDPPQLRTDEPVAVTALDSAGPGWVDPSADQVWAADQQEASLPAPERAVFEFGGGAGSSTPEAFPVTVRPRSAHPALGYAGPQGSVTVEILAEEVAQAAGVAGVLVEVAPSGFGTAEVVLDYGRFADRFGGGWASRLRLLELPACALTTPAVAGCLTPTPVETRYDRAKQQLSTDVELGRAGGVEGGAGRLLAVAAVASSEGAGDYRATDLSPAGSWAAGGGDGAFTYGYPLRVPPSSGPVPSITLGYSSASHDGRTSGRNNQASWVGDGWGYEPGFVERSYRPCSLDEDGSNNPQVTGDLCWDGDGASVTMSLNGTNTTLVRDDATGVWRSEADGNWRIELLGSPASASSPTSERWRVTTPDGTQFFFAAEAAASSSRLTVPVFGNHPGEPCRQSAFANSSCRQAYRWLLDKVVDVHGNMARYFYTTTTGQYGAAGDADNRQGYHRSGQLTRIEYGLRDGQPGVAATGRVIFDTDLRCFEDCGTVSNPEEENWPDTPWDLHCASAPCTTQLSPVFFATDRLSSVTTQVREGSGFRDVDSWELEHEFKDYGDDEQVTLWLQSIRHIGHVGGQASLPQLEFGGEALPNRVDAAPGVPVMWRWRLSSVKTETGAVITVGYADPQCSPSSLPGNAHNNSTRCYPVRWTPEFHTEPIEDWFHKHVVASVVETDTTGGMPAVETSYEYATSGGGTSVLWAFDDSEFTEDEHRTYNQWRGFPQVTTLLGDPAQPQTRTRARFYRGMDGQPLPSGGVRSVSLTDAEGNTVIDHEVLAGRVWESLSYDGSSIIGGGTYEFWTRRSATQDRDHDGGSLDAWLSGVTVERSRTRLTASVWQRTETRTSFDNEGRVTQVNSLGDTSRSGDEHCQRIEYTGSTGAWIRDTVSRAETVAVACGAATSRPQDVVSDTRTFYDGSDTHGAAPSRGLPTRVDVVDGWDSGPVYVTTARTGYDALGRIVQTSDALQRVTTMAYTPAGAGPLVETTTTNALGHVQNAVVEPAWGAPVVTVEANGRRTELAYDPLGRTTGVWLPGRSRTAQSPNLEFEYLVRDNAPSAVTTRTMNHNQDYVVGVVLFDSLLRQRQTQSETADHGRLITETVYDTQGRVEEEFGPNYHDDPPGTTIVRVREDESARRFEYLFDGAGRVTDEIFYNKHEQRWRTSTSYGGNSSGFMVAVQPPQGAPGKATITDALGRTVEKRTYHGNAPSGSFDALTYDYSPTGRLEAMSDEAGNQWSWEYDLRGRQVGGSDPDAGVTSMVYDIAGQLVSTTDARGETIVNDYDALGRQVTRHDGDDTLLAEWEYDTAHGGLGALAKATRWHDGEAYVNQVHTINALGLVSQASITLPAKEGPLAGQHWFTQGFFPNGQVGGQALGEIGELERGSIRHTYDHVGNDDSLSYQDRFGITVIVDQATYTPFGEIQTRLFGGTGAPRLGWHGFVYEEDTRRLERAVFDREASIESVADVRYSYDDAGNVLSIADVPEGLPSNHELQCFQYDHNRRLTEAWAQGDTSSCATTPGMGVLGGPAPYWHSYDHDVTGNRVSDILRAPGQTATTRSYTYPAAGQPRPHALQQVSVTSGAGESIAYTYDESGNTTSREVDGQVQTLHWDAEGRIETVEDGDDNVRMVYDTDGSRLIRDDGDSVTAYLPHTEVTWDRDNNTVTGTRYFTHAGQVVATCTGTDVADWVWLGVDHHGTTATHAVNAFTAVEQVRRMDPYGNPRGPAPHAWPGQQGFVGGVQDPTGLTHIGARSYDPLTGRFLSVDPILALGDDQQINGYAYAHNNPISFTDPTGLVATCAPDAFNICPDYNVKNQPRVGKRGHPPKSTAHNGPTRTGSGSGESGSFWTEYSDGSLVINDIYVPTGSVGGLSPAEVAALIDQVLHSMHLQNTDHDTYFVIIQLCGHGDLECDDDIFPWLTEVTWLITGDPSESGTRTFWEGGAMAPAIGVGVIKRPLNRGYCSFSADTEVLMADGATKPIAEIEPGDEVLTADPSTGERSVQTVTAVWVHVDLLLDLRLLHDNAGGIGGLRGPAGGMVVTTATTTADHPFWNQTDQQWQPATELATGARLLTPNGARPAVIGLDHDTATHGDAYNLTVTTTHTYYVIAGNTPVLVHNTNGCSANPNTPTGSKGNPLFIRTPNQPTVINGREYSGHALDRMQQQGIPPSVVENATRGAAIPGKRPGTTAYYDKDNHITVITDSASGRVVTVDYGKIRQ